MTAVMGSLTFGYSYIHSEIEAWLDGRRFPLPERYARELLADLELETHADANPFARTWVMVNLGDMLKLLDDHRAGRQPACVGNVPFKSSA